MENVSPHGTVRVCETYQKSVAELVARQANMRFADSGQDAVSRVVPA